MWAKLDKLGFREKAGLALALLFVGGVLADRLAVQRVADRIEAMTLAVESQNTALALNRRILKTEPQVRAEYDAWRERLAQVGSDAEAIDALKGRLDDLARASGLVIASMQDRRAGETDGEPTPYRELVVDIGRFESTMNGLITFLYRLRQSPDLLKVLRLNVTPGKEGDAVAGSIVIGQLVETASEE